MEIERDSYREKVLFTARIALTATILTFVVYHSFTWLLFIFAGVLVAIFFRGLSHFLASKTPLSPSWSLAIVIFFIAASSFLAWYFMAPAVIQQVNQLKDTFPHALNKLSEWSASYPWMRDYMQEINFDKVIRNGAGGALLKATNFATTLLNGLVQIVLIIFIGLYFAVSPHTYINGFLALIPNKKRGRVEEVLGKISRVLRWWLIGRFIDMAFIGSLIWLGLWLLDVPLALILAIIAGVLNFIPNIGPFLGAIPAILIGFTQGPDTVLWILILFTVIQTLESVFTTPMVQQRAIHLPPGLTITSQIILGAAFGTIGLAVATPLIAAIIVAIKEFYVKDSLGNQVEN